MKKNQSIKNMNKANTSPRHQDYDPSREKIPDGLQLSLELDEFFHMPSELWPEEATEMILKPNYLWGRTSKWIPVTSFNESNKRLIGECVRIYKEKHPDSLNPLDNDDFWLEYVGDSVISQSISNRDYIFEADFRDPKIFKTAMRNFDIVFQETIGGFVCNPFIVYDIRYRYHYYAYVEYDDYAKSRFDEFDRKWESEHPDDTLSKWSKDAILDFRKLRIDMIKEGHASFTVKTSPDPEYMMEIRWINHSNEKSDKPFGILHKGNY